MEIKDIYKKYENKINSSLPNRMFDKLNQKYNIPEERHKAVKEALGATFSEDELKPFESEFQKKLKEYEESLKDNTDIAVKEQNQNNKLKAENNENQSRIEMDTVTSRKVKEPELWDTKYTNTVNNKDGDSSFAKSYPNSSGYINEVGDFIRIDKKLGDVQIIHRSGTCVKIDIKGNVTINTKGTLKQVIEGDMALNIKGNLDISADKIYIHSKENTDMVADGNLNIKAPVIEHTGSMIKGSGTEINVGNNITTSSEVNASAYNCI